MTLAPLKPVSGRTTVEMYDLGDNHTGRISCYYNLGHPSHLLAFKDSLVPLGLVSVQYNGNDQPQHLIIKTITKTVCLMEPGESEVPMNERYLNTEFYPFREGSAYEILNNRYLKVSVTLTKVDRIPVGNRVSVVSLSFDVG